MTGNRHKSRRRTCFGISNQKCTYLIPWLSIVSSPSYTVFSAKIPSRNPAKAAALTKVPEHKRKGKESHRFCLYSVVLARFCLDSHRPEIAKFCRSARLKPSKKAKKQQLLRLCAPSNEANASESRLFNRFYVFFGKDLPICLSKSQSLAKTPVLKAELLTRRSP